MLPLIRCGFGGIPFESNHKYIVFMKEAVSIISCARN